MLATHPAPRQSAALLLTREQVCDALSVSPATLDRLRRSGKLPAPVRIRSGCLRWRAADLERYVRRLAAGEAGG